MKTSDKGIDLIKELEGFRTKAYPDPASKDGLPITIGFGRAHGVKLGDTCTPAQAEQWLREDVQDAEECINAHVTVPLSQHAYDALVSFIYNLGCGDFERSTLLKLLNQGDRKGASMEFHKWVYAGGHISHGLQERREKEAYVFRHGY